MFLINLNKIEPVLIFIFVLSCNNAWVVFLCFEIAFKAASLVYLPKFCCLNILRYQGSVLYWKKSYLKPQQFVDQF